MRARCVHFNRLSSCCVPVHRCLSDLFRNTHVQCTYTNRNIYRFSFVLFFSFYFYIVFVYRSFMCALCTYTIALYSIHSNHSVYSVCLDSFIFYQSIVQTDLTLCMHKSLKYVFIVCVILLVVSFFPRLLDVSDNDCHSCKC